MSALKLAISAIISVPVKIDVLDGDKTVTHRFTLQCERLEQDKAIERLNATSPKEFLLSVAKGWAGQRLVVTEADQPADFSPEALGMLLGLFGSAAVIANKYVEVVGSIAKN